MLKCLSITLLVFLNFNLYTQPLTAKETVKQYTLAQKMLLVHSTAQFTHLITQNRLDKDSVMLIACGVTGLSFLTAYADEFDPELSSVGNELIDAGKITEASRLLYKLEGNDRVQLLIKLAIWYLHKAGTNKPDLDNVNRYIQEALTLSSTIPGNKHRYECLNLLAEYYRQSGNEEQSKKIYSQVILSNQQEGNNKEKANALHQLGTMHMDLDSLNLVYLNKSLALYKLLNLKEKEIELLWDVATYHINVNISLVKNDLIDILAIQKSINYSHSLFADYMLAWVYGQQRDYMEVEKTNTAVKNMEWSGMSALEGAFYTRMAVVYNAFEKYDEALSWYKKALEHRSNETNIFWFKGLLYATTMLSMELNRPKESLSLMQKVISQCPPLTPWQKAQVFTIKGDCYKMLDNHKLADDNYMSFLKLTNQYQDMDTFGEFSGTYLQIAEFYIGYSNLTTARLFVNKGIATRRDNEVRSTFLINHLLFRLDSAAGNYKSALDHYIQYKIADDLDRNTEQRKAFDELTIKYDSEKKDNDIKLLQKDKQIQGSMLLQAKYTRNWILAGVALLLVIVTLLVYYSRLKQQTNKKLESHRSEIEKRNAALRHLVDEKDWLVKEIHHRVKNNLQIVMSLLNSQSAFIENDAALTAIHDSQHRVQAMSLIHQKLYNTENVSSIEFSNYIRELTSYLRNSFNTGQRIRFEFDVEPLEMDVSEAVPLGLILNEAITNSIKYAFPDGRKGVITISLTQKDANHYLLNIADNGIGMPVNSSNKKPGSLGMSLMAGLSEDLNGSFSIEDNSGTIIRISFYHDSNSKLTDIATHAIGNNN